jgi:hypothetical protein
VDDDRRSLDVKQPRDHSAPNPHHPVLAPPAR